MSNQLQQKAATLAQILAANKLTKAAEQEIEHKGLLDQTNLGKEQTEEIHQNVEGVNADTPAAANPSHENVQEVPGAQSLNASPESALNATGTTVDTITPDGNATGTPAEQAKSASDYRAELAGILAAMKKQASAQAAPAANEPAANAPANTPAANADDFRTGSEVLAKFASLTPNSTEEDLAAAKEELVKLASTNPVFHICRDRILMAKMAEDIDALAEAEGISPEEAAAELDAAAAANPDMIAEMEDEANGEAVADLAAAEEATDAFMGDIQGMADNASAALGQEVTPDMIIAAADETVALADELGVPPEALIQAAMEEMMGAGAAPEVTPEDEANAQAILDEAAANGISPEEVIQMASEELGGAPAAPAAEPAAEPPVEKAASLQKRAGTMRAAFVQELRRNRK